MNNKEYEETNKKINKLWNNLSYKQQNQIKEEVITNIIKNINMYPYSIYEFTKING